MFKSFFPNPKLFFLSLLGFFIIVCGLWYGYKQELAQLVGLDIEQEKPEIGLGHFFTDSFLLLLRQDVLD